MDLHIVPKCFIFCPDPPADPMNRAAIGQLANAEITPSHAGKSSIISLEASNQVNKYFAAR